MLKIIFRRNCVVFLVIILQNTFYTILGSSESAFEETDGVSALKMEPKDKTNEKRLQQWPLGVVPYYVEYDIYDGLVAERIRLAMDSIEESSCIQFKPLTDPSHDAAWIYITNPLKVRECVHDTGANGTGGQIVMVLGLDCMKRRDILHSLMHAIGFKDEITHPQRDRFVRIKWDNINSEYRSLFHINYEDFPTRTTEYDPMSIMHFHDRAFTKNGQATIAPLIPGLIINPSKELSSLDKMKLRLMFGHECNRRKVGDLVDVCKAALQENPRDDGASGGSGHNNDGVGSGNRDADVNDGYGSPSNGGYGETGNDVTPGSGGYGDSGHVSLENHDEDNQFGNGNNIEYDEKNNNKNHGVRKNYDTNKNGDDGDENYHNNNNYADDQDNLEQDIYPPGDEESQGMLRMPTKGSKLRYNNKNNKKFTKKN